MPRRTWRCCASTYGGIWFTTAGTAALPGRPEIHSHPARLTRFVAEPEPPGERNGDPSAGRRPPANRDGQAGALRVSAGRLTDATKMQRAMARVQRFYTVKATLAVALLTDHRNLAAPEVWMLYIRLTKAEKGFCALNSSLGLRLKYHQMEDRGEDHVFLMIPAYHLPRRVLQTLKAVRGNRSWENLRQVLQTSCYTTCLPPALGAKLTGAANSASPGFAGSTSTKPWASHGTIYPRSNCLCQPHNLAKNRAILDCLKISNQ